MTSFRMKIETLTGLRFSSRPRRGRRRLSSRLAAQHLGHLPDRRAVLDEGLEARALSQDEGQRAALQRQRKQYLEMPGLDIAPQPLVGLVADREVIDCEAGLAGLLDVVEEQEVAGAGVAEIVVGDRPEFADQAFARSARSGDRAKLAGDFESMQHEGRFFLGKRFNEQGTEESADLRRAEHIGDAHLAEAQFLHLKKSIEQPVRLFLCPGLEAAMAADGVELAHLRAVLLALALAAGAGKQRIEAAGEIDGQRQIGTGKMREGRKRIGSAVEIGQQPLQRDEVDIGPGPADCQENRAKGRRYPPGPASAGRRRRNCRWRGARP